MEGKEEGGEGKRKRKEEEKKKGKKRRGLKVLHMSFTYIRGSKKSVWRLIKKTLW